MRQAELRAYLPRRKYTDDLPETREWWEKRSKIFGVQTLERAYKYPR